MSFRAITGRVFAGVRRRSRAVQLAVFAIVVTAALGVGYWWGSAAANRNRQPSSEASLLKQLQSSLDSSPHKQESKKDSPPPVKTNPSGVDSSHGAFTTAGTVERVTNDGFVLVTSSGNRLLVVTDRTQTRYQPNSIKVSGSKPVANKLQAGQIVRVTCSVKPAGQFLATAITIQKAAE